jgi:hypothetical protein
MTEKYCSENMDELLVSSGYRNCGPTRHCGDHGDNNPVLFQKRILSRDDNPDLENGVRFINVWKWDNRYLRSTERVGYEVESVFELKSGEWANLSFYSMENDELKDKLPVIEDRIKKVFKDFEGDYQY